MALVELELKEEVLRRAERSAEASHSTLGQWLTNAIERSAAPADENCLLGLFADAPDLIDAVLEDALMSRENHSLRLPYG